MKPSFRQLPHKTHRSCVPLEVEERPGAQASLRSTASPSKVFLPMQHCWSRCRRAPSGRYACLARVPKTMHEAWHSREGSAACSLLVPIWTFSVPYALTPQGSEGSRIETKPAFPPARSRAALQSRDRSAERGRKYRVPLAVQACAGAMRKRSILRALVRLGVQGSGPSPPEKTTGAR